MNQPAFKIQVTDTLQNSKKLQQIGLSESHVGVFVRIIEDSSAPTLEIVNKSIEQLITDNRIFRKAVRADSIQLSANFKAFTTEIKTEMRWHLVIVITVITALAKDIEWSKALESIFAIIATVL